MKILHFCGGLPRSGSTVLMNILQQNPRIFTDSSSALPDLIHQHVVIKSRFREFFQAMNAEQADSAMYGFVHGGTQGWFNGLTNKPVVISKNRSWNNIFHLYPRSKYIVMVRDVRDIVDSFERLNKKILCLHTFGDNNRLIPAMNEPEKIQYYLETENSLSHCLNTELPRMMELFPSTSDRIHFIRYEDFTQDPGYILRKLYNFLEEPYFDHDLENIQQSEMFEHDNAYFRERTSHVTDRQFRYYNVPTRTISERIQAEIVRRLSWFYKGFYPEVLK